MRRFIFTFLVLFLTTPVDNISLFFFLSSELFFSFTKAIMNCVYYCIICFLPFSLSFSSIAYYVSIIFHFSSIISFIYARVFIFSFFLIYFILFPFHYLFS
uniref:Uncharacterized protein n=1 Tax=Cacopsylla melanoneura TaxID=428564 RepID=A0A8D9BF43_9HEMI